MDGERQAPEQTLRAGVFRDAGPLARALVAHRPRTVALALALMLASSAAETFGFLMLIPVLHAVDAGAAEHGSGAIAELMIGLADALGTELTLPSALAIFVALAILRAATVWQRDLLLAKTRFGFVDGLRETLHEAAAWAKWQFLAGQRRSDIQHALTGDVHRIGQATRHLLQMVATGTLVATQTAIAFLISPLVSSAALLAGLALLALTRPLRRRSRALGDQLVGSNRLIFSHVMDFLAALKVVKSYAAERIHASRFGKAVAAMRQRQLASVTASAAAQATLQVGGAAALAAMAWLAIAEAGLPLPELTVLVLLFARVMSVLANLQESAQGLVNMAPAFSHAQTMLGALRQATEDAAGEMLREQEGEVRPKAPPMALNAALKAQAVSFDYERQARSGPASQTADQALTDVHLEIRSGEITAISGPSGAGKSTLADILLGLLEPTSGAVLVDGVPLNDSNRRRWRRSCAYVPQDAQLFHDTIRANIAWPRPAARDEHIQRALRLAAATEFVAELPLGLDTPVGDRGERLSGGERQRIALARALLAAPTLLVLDEATSQLDAQTEQRIVEALRSLRGRMTIVAVTHREALLAAADRVLLLDAGHGTTIGAWPEPSKRAKAASGRSRDVLSGNPGQGAAPRGDAHCAAQAAQRERAENAANDDRDD